MNNPIIVKYPHRITTIEVWAPKWDDTSLVGDYDEPVALVHKRKTDFADTGVIFVTFPKTKSLQNQRFAIYKQYAQTHTVGTNSKAPMYEIPMSHFSPYETVEEIRAIVDDLFPAHNAKSLGTIKEEL